MSLVQIAPSECPFYHFPLRTALANFTFSLGNRHCRKYHPVSHYTAFYELHHQPAPFILPNAWNAASARAIEAAGFKAVGTSSGAIAASMGYADGEQMPFAEVCHIIRRIRSATSLPLSVDMERGYTTDLHQLCDNLQQLVEAGVAGINIEDAEGEDPYLKKLETIKNYLVRHNLSLFINARTDAFSLKLEAPLETTLRRAQRYANAGADGLFVTGLQDTDLLGTIAASTSLPLNVVGTPTLNNIDRLQACGVKRISMAVFLYRATYTALEKTLAAIQNQHSLAPLYPA